MSGPALNRASWIEPLNSQHDRSGFSCGVSSLDLYLQKQASQDFKKHAAVSFVLTPDGITIADCYTVCSTPYI